MGLPPLFCCCRSFFRQPREQLVDPSDGEAKPTILRHRFAAKAQQKLAEWIVGIRQSTIEEENVGIVVFPSPDHRLPNGHRGRMEPGIALAARGEVPQICVALGIDTHAATDQPTFIECGKETGIVAAKQLGELFLLWHDTMHFPPIEATHQMHEALELVFGLYLARLHSLLIGVFDLFQHLGLQTVMGIHGMERVVDFLPKYWEEALSTEKTIAKHFARDVAELYEETKATAQPTDKRLQQYAENFLAVDVFGIVALTVSMCLPVKERQPRGPLQKDKDVAGHAARAVESHCHTRPLPGSSFYDMEEFRAVEKVAAVHRRQCVSTRIDCGLILRHRYRMIAYWQN